MNNVSARLSPLLVLSLSCLILVAGLCGAGDAGGDAQSRAITPASELSPEERATIAVFDKSARSVVFITNTGIRRDLFSLNLFEVPQGSGSGFVWDKAGHIVTNFHVVYGADQINVIMADRTDHKAKIVGVDPDHDLAVLQIKASPDLLVPIPVGTSGDLRVGQKVLAIGNPFGLDHTLTTGVVSALGRTIKSMTDRTIDGVIQTDAAINPGNSGGPLLDGAGRLIGINTQIISPSGAYAGIGFAVPVDTIHRIVPELIQHGKLIKPGLGVTLIPDAIARQWGIKGLVIGRVLRGGAAERIGLKGVRESFGGRIELGDIIVGIDGRAVSELDEFLSVLDRHKVGDRVSVEYLREGKRYQVAVTLQVVE